LLFLARILAFLGVLWVLQRLLGFFFGKSAKPAKPDGAGTAPTNTVKDPVCGMYMDPRLAIRCQHEGKDIFFCSEECRRKYLDGKANPG
jgi:YHS domain-containing protein